MGITRLTFKKENMKMLIEIDCDNLQELYSHLSQMKVAVFKLMKKIKGTDELPVGFTLEDDNCYGSHYAIVKESGVI
jgi:hypothetical protein